MWSCNICDNVETHALLQDHEILGLLSSLARAPSYTLAVAGGFRGVVLHIVSAMADTEPRSHLAADLGVVARTREALNGAALLRMLDITPHAQR